MQPATAREKSSRQTASPARLLLAALGGPQQIAGKAARIAVTLSTFAHPTEVRRRLQRLHERGHLPEIPSRLQLAACGLDMLRFFIVPAARAYYHSRGINFTFHQVLRFLDDPVSVIDPVGVLSARDTIIGHLLQVVHANPAYDLQLLEMFEDGLEELERQTEAMVDGRHPRQKTIGAIVEDPGYHERLLAYVRAYRRDPEAPPLLREHDEARRDPAFVLAERTFGTFTSAMRYANRLPRDLRRAARHLLGDRAIRPEHCDPEVARAFPAAA